MVLLLAGPALAVAQWNSNRAPLAALAFIEQNRSPGDSAMYASAVYHGAHARASNDSRWRLTGYATLGVIAAVVGTTLLLASRSPRSAR